MINQLMHIIVLKQLNILMQPLFNLCIQNTVVLKAIRGSTPTVHTIPFCEGSSEKQSKDMSNIYLLRRKINWFKCRHASIGRMLLP